MDNINYEQLATALLQKSGAIAQKAVVSSTPSTIMGHGAGGLFSHPALERQVFSAMLLPYMGLQSILPVVPSQFENPLHGIFTGVTDTTGAEPVGVCDDPPTVGLSKLCMHTFVYGRQSRQSRVFELDRFGKLNDRADHMDLQLLGNPFNTPANAQNVPSMPGMSSADGALRNEITKALFELAVGWSRDFATEIYDGNPANNTAGGGRKFFNGLNILINNGYRDAVTGVACPAADSLIHSFHNLNVGANGTEAVETFTAVYRNLKYRAQKMGLDPASWVIAMPWQMFVELTEVWPCAYHTYRCQTGGGLSTSQVLDISSPEVIRMRDDMRGDLFNRTGQYLLIDGQKIPVIADDAITEDGIGAGEQRSQAYFVPMTVLGATPVTFLNHFDYSVPGGAMEAASVFSPGQHEVSDSGRFLWHRKPADNFCVQILAKTEPRLLLLTPMIAARITNIQYTPLINVRSPFNDSDYFVDGGSTVQAGPSFFSPTA